MKISLKKIDFGQLDRAIAAIAEDHDGVNRQFADKNAVDLLKKYIGPFMAGVMLRLLENQGSKELRLDAETLANLANSLVHFGVAIGRHYELCDPEERMTPCSVSAVYERHGQDK